MLPFECTPRQVKEAVALADALKAGPFDPDGFREKLAEARNTLRSFSENDIDEKYLKAHQDRLRRIDEGRWTMGMVELAACLTWRHFGGRQWADTRPVNATADLMRQINDPSDRLWEMSKSAHLFFATLPIIVIRMNKNPSRFFIDDGAHRAVAYYLAGFREAFAYIGVVREEINHKWEWQGW